MKQMEEKILNEGRVLPGGVLKVGSFLNQQIDTRFLKEVGAKIAELYKDSGVTKILTIEASGIPIAVAAGMELDVPVVFAKKSRNSIVSGDVFSSLVFSFTHGQENHIIVSKEYLSPDDNILVVDDFLAHGSAMNGLIAIAEDAGAKVVGCAAAIEKGFQLGGDNLRARGYRVESLAILEDITDEDVTFRE